MSNWRGGISPSLIPIQQSLTADASHYEHYNMRSLMLGVVLEVYPADAVQNRSAQRHDDRRGHAAEAKVLLVGTNVSSNLVVDHVTITCAAPTGLDNYEENLPRPSTQRVDGAMFNATGNNVDPYDLDGDWCIVGFLGGSLDQPFILTWWPHPRNTLDPATTGLGNPDTSGNSRALDQSGRYFKRINGVEFIITDTGDIYLSTAYTNATLNFSAENSATRGRWNRTVNEEVGGSLFAQFKPSQVLELSFDPAQDGFGLFQQREDSLPQTNPRVDNGPAPELTNTHATITKDSIRLETDKFNTVVRSRFHIASEDIITLVGKGKMTFEAPVISLGENAESTQGVVRGFDLYTWLSNLTVLTATGPAKINPADLAVFISDTVSTKTIVE